MSKQFPLYFILSLLMGGAVAGCNTDSDVVSIDNNYVNCAVTSFSLQRDDSVAYRLDSVFFAIDLVGAEVFNADSLPVGTDVSALLVTVGTESAKECKVTYPLRNADRDTTVNLIEHPNDSINFSKGPVKLEIVSYNGQARREYTVRVNVHKSVPDTLVWETERPLDSEMAAMTAQKSVEWRGAVYCFATDGTAASMRWSPTWEGDFGRADITLPEGARIETITPAGDELCCVGADGELYSTSTCLAWTPTGVKMDHVYGEYEGRVIGAARDTEGTWMCVTYPATEPKALPAGCPVSGTSQMVEFTSKWNVTPTAVVVGGRNAAGELTGESWAYDGSSWGRLGASKALEIEGAVLFPYNTPKVDRAWRVNDESVLVAMCGRKADGKEGEVVMNTEVYVSPDFGINWKRAAATLQPSEEFTPVSGAQAYVIKHELSFDPSEPLPIATPQRVVTPITRWECPYIYMYGGIEADGKLFTSYRRGVINRYTFRPVY